MTDAPKITTKACQAILAVFSWGPRRCGIMTRFSVLDDEQEWQPICKTHWRSYRKLSQEEESS